MYKSSKGMFYGQSFLEIAARSRASSEFSVWLASDGSKSMNKLFGPAPLWVQFP
jgi:hypothetical protein